MNINKSKAKTVKLGGGEEKHTFEAFVRLIAAEKSIRSKANKEWRVVRANAPTTVILDVSRRQEHRIPTRAIYDAHLALDADEIQVATLIPYVGRVHAPAASALLYNIVGNGQRQNNLRKFVNSTLKQGGFEELQRRLAEIKERK